MEFRIFFPVYTNNDAVNAVNSERREHTDAGILKQIYNDTIRQISALFAQQRGLFESRTDTYIACSNHFGLKFRKEKNLELKVKQPHTGNLPVSSGIEIYLKDKIKKLDDGLDDAKFKSKVKKHLKEMNYERPEDSDKLNSILDNTDGRLHSCAINVEKSRVNTQITQYHAVQEYCILSTVFKHPIVCSTSVDAGVSVFSNDAEVHTASAVSATTSSNYTSISSWISVAYEGDLEYFFREGLKTDQPYRNAATTAVSSRLNGLLWKSVYIALLLARENDDKLVIPVVIAGYPTWVQYISLMGQGLSGAAEQEQHLFRMLTDFVDFLGTVITGYPQNVDVTTIQSSPPSVITSDCPVTP